MSTKPNLPIKKRGDKLTAEEFNAVVNYFLKKMEQDDLPESMNGKSAYEIAVELGFEGSEEEWLNSLSPNRYFDSNVFTGEGTSEADKVTLKAGAVNENHLSEAVKQKLEGIGQDGEDGREVEFQKSATHIQWRYIGDADWVNLVALSELQGDPANTEAVELESNTVLFDQDYIIGNTAPRTGNVLFDFTGAVLGSCTVMVHEDANPFTLPAESVVIGGEVKDNVPNYIYFLLINKTIGSEKVHVTISQEVI